MLITQEKNKRKQNEKLFINFSVFCFENFTINNIWIFRLHFITEKTKRKPKEDTETIYYNQQLITGIQNVCKPAEYVANPLINTHTQSYTYL